MRTWYMMKISNSKKKKSFFLIYILKESRIRISRRRWTVSQRSKIQFAKNQTMTLCIVYVIMKIWDNEEDLIWDSRWKFRIPKKNQNFLLYILIYFKESRRISNFKKMGGLADHKFNFIKNAMNKGVSTGVRL